MARRRVLIAIQCPASSRVDLGKKTRVAGAVVLAVAGLTLAPSVAQAAPSVNCVDDYGTNFQVRVQYCGGQNGYTAEGFNHSGDGFWGHIEIWGPGMNRHNGPDGWRRNGNGTWSSVGLPCVTIG